MRPKRWMMRTGIPVDVVVDEVVAVLKVLAFGDAVGGDQQVDLAFGGQLRRALLRAGREGGQDAAEVVAQVRQGGLVAPGAGDERACAGPASSAPTAPARA